MSLTDDLRTVTEESTDNLPLNFGVETVLWTKKTKEKMVSTSLLCSYFCKLAHDTLDRIISATDEIPSFFFLFFLSIFLENLCAQAWGFTYKNGMSLGRCFKCT